MDWRCLTLTWSKLACPGWDPVCSRPWDIIMSGLLLALTLVNLAMILDGPDKPRLALKHIGGARLTLALNGEP